MVVLSLMCPELTATHPQFHILFFQPQAHHGSQPHHHTPLQVDGLATNTFQLQVDGKLQPTIMKLMHRDSLSHISQFQPQTDTHHMSTQLILALTHQEKL